MAEIPSLTDTEAQILSHSLGLNRAKASYRNHYIPGSDDAAHCEDLVARGLMGRRDVHPELTGGGTFYFVTERGIEAITAKLGGALRGKFVEGRDG